MENIDTTINGKEFNRILVLISGYIFLQIMSDLTVSKFISITQDLSIPVGSLLYAISFTWIDLINDSLGKKRARMIVNSAILINILMVLWLQFYIRTEPASWWAEDPFPQSAINYAFGGVARVIIASITAEFIVEHTDVTIFHFLKSFVPKWTRWSRSLISNTISAPLDGVLFALLAFGGSVSPVNLETIILGSVLYKLAVGYISTPLIFLVRSTQNE